MILAHAAQYVVFMWEDSEGLCTEIWWNEVPLCVFTQQDMSETAHIPLVIMSMSGGGASAHHRRRGKHQKKKTILTASVLIDLFDAFKCIDLFDAFKCITVFLFRVEAAGHVAPTG